MKKATKKKSKKKKKRFDQPGFSEKRELAKYDHCPALFVGDGKER